MTSFRQKPAARFSLFFICIFILTFLTSTFALYDTKIWTISSINLTLFSLLISLIAASTAIVFFNKSLYVTIKSPKYLKCKLFAGLILILATILIFQFFLSPEQVLFIQWSEIQPFLVLFTFFVFIAALYVPGYVFHKTVIAKYNFGLLERVVFYPVISALILGVLEALFSSINLFFIYKFIFICFLVSASFLLFCGSRKSSRNSENTGKDFSILSFDLAKVLAISSAIALSVFLIYSALGSQNAFLRGDMWTDAQSVSSFSKYGFSEFFSSPISGYPPFYYLFWSAIVQLLPIPIVNGLIFIAFFNHMFSILALFLLARFVFKDNRAAVFCVILWVTLSDFSFIGVFLNSQGTVLSGSQQLNFITNIYAHFGVYSGGRVSTIYADDHTLTRLWSLALMFASSAAILKAFSDKKYLKEGLFIFSIGLLQILMGHMTEVPILSIILLISILLLRPRFEFLKISLIAIGATSALGLLLAWLTYGRNLAYLLISISPIISFFFAMAILKLRNTFRIRLHQEKMNASLVKTVKASFAAVLIFSYGLMWIAFFQRGGNVSNAITTIWYFPAIEWGFLGLVAVVALVWFLIGKITLTFGLKLALSMLGSQLLLLVVLNYLNYNGSFIEFPYPLEPILFLPFLALLGAQFFLTLNSKVKFWNFKIVVVVSLVLVLLFSFAPLDNVISSSYNGSYGGWWSSSTPSNFSAPDYELMNYLYTRVPTQSYDFVGTLDDWNNPSAYVVYPTGMTTLSAPLITILSTTPDSQEFYLLTHTFPIQYVLIPKDRPLPPSKYLNFDGINDSATVQSSDTLKTSNGFTIDFWVVLHGGSTGIQDIFSQRTLSNKVLIRRLADDRINFFVWTASGKENSLTLDALPVNTPVHLALTFDKESGLVIIYKNGFLMSSMVVNGTVANDDMTISIGKYSNGNLYFFNGLLSNLEVYNRALSATEISQIYSSKGVPTTHEGDVLRLPMSILNGNETADTSGNNNNARVDGATIKEEGEAFLLSAIDTVEPIFKNEKYNLYLSSSLQSSQTTLLNTTGFLTFENLAITGNLTVTDQYNRQMCFTNGNFTINSGNNGNCVLNVWANGVSKQNVTVLTPFISINGNMSFVNMKSSWTYFREISCIASNLTINGKASFQVPNTFSIRVYTTNFTYSGNFNAYPQPAFFRVDYTKIQIDNYLASNYINPWNVATTPVGLIWIICNISALTLAILYIKKSWLFRKRLQKDEKG